MITRITCNNNGRDDNVDSNNGDSDNRVDKNNDYYYCYNYGYIDKHTTIIVMVILMKIIMILVSNEGNGNKDNQNNDDIDNDENHHSDCNNDNHIYNNYICKRMRACRVSAPKINEKSKMSLDNNNKGKSVHPLQDFL